MGLLSLRFILFLFVQVLICNNINFLGFINPYIYIVFILVYPVYENRLPFLFISFLLGVCIDIFSDSGGVNAAASVTLAYIRPVLLKNVYGVQYEHQNLKLKNSEFGNLVIYITLATLIHHLVLFQLEIFNLYKIGLVLKNTLTSTIFTFIVSTSIILLFNKVS